MDLIAFARGVPAPEMLPIKALERAAVKAFEQNNVSAMLSYGTGSGWPPLQERIAQQFGVESERVVVTTGSLHGFQLLMQAIATRAREEGRTAKVIVEEPSYDRPLLIMRELGIETVPVPLSADGGVDIGLLERAMHSGADAAYIIPTYQNPAGSTLSDSNRDRVVALARQYQVPLLEDDPYGLLHFDQPAPKSIFSRTGDMEDDTELFWYSGSVSKTVAPGLRVGWFILPKYLAATVAKRANDSYISPSFVAQATLDRYFAAGDFEPGVENARKILHERRDVMVEALEQHIPEASFEIPDGGYFMWIKLPHTENATFVAERALQNGVSIVAGSSFGANCESFARLAFSSPPIEHIAPGIERLAKALEH